MRPNPGTTLNGAIQRNDANALAFGLAEAGRKGQVRPGSTIWNRCKMLSSYCGVARQEMRQFRFLRSIKPLLINYLNGAIVSDFLRYIREDLTTFCIRVGLKVKEKCPDYSNKNDEI
ncbi:hypothetical protein GTQ43_39265 [Nostoc sp. KVJ3]|uniref:hypothetical protein n=1 Tax=Nostoc sp. KVJ3 TaxID=457945 RepID=UPI00223790DA|nr:hypothetical protein [Nostoc sp. KVJ3]MCW5319391.1 hypothetical protein [Nostoc sp. KVJ3]